MFKIGVIGYGYWGPNIVRNFMSTERSRVEMICDINPKNLEKVKKIYPAIRLTDDYKEVFQSPDIDIVAIVTPVSTHYHLAKSALECGKHVFIEKPFTTTEKDAEELVGIADKKQLKIMVDHTFVFTGAVQKIKQLMDDGELGDLLYYDSTRVSLGLFQQDTNVIWDLAPHDFSIIDFITDKKPLAITAQGVDHMNHGYENIAYITAHFQDNFLVHINVNWLSPVKVRTTLVSGHKKMLVWDDLQADEKIKVYDKGVDVTTKEGINQLKIDYRSGDMWSPRVEHTEALLKEANYFLDCIEENKSPFNDGCSGLRVVRMLEACQRSLERHGQLIKFRS